MSDKDDLVARIRLVITPRPHYITPRPHYMRSGDDDLMQEAAERIEALESELSVWRESMPHMKYIGPCLVTNEGDKWVSELTSLKAENERLREQIEVLEDVVCQTEDCIGHIQHKIIDMRDEKET